MPQVHTYSASVAFERSSIQCVYTLIISGIDTAGLGLSGGIPRTEFL